MKERSEESSEEETKRKELRKELLKKILNNEGRRRIEAQVCAAAAGSR